MTLPPLPAWDALHVLVVHLPIGLLLVAVPLLLVLALLFPKTGRQFVWATAIVIVVGTACCFLAAKTGEAAAELAEAQGVEEDPAIHETFEEHEHGGERARNIYAILCLAFLIYLFVPVAIRRSLNPALNAALLALFLGAYSAAGIQLANTAHLGGLLVHEHGITAPLTESAAAAAKAAVAGGEHSAGEYESGEHDTE